MPRLHKDKLSGLASGPVLLEDFATLEKIATLGREVIPARVVHALGASAKGYFKARYAASLQ